MKKCALCRSSLQDSLKYGEFLTKNNINVHTFCLYLTSNLKQDGSENNGLLGFLPKHIESEAERVSKLTCCYCNKRYANIGCCARKCRRCFHFICGLEHGCANQFINTYMSFCSLHITLPKTQPKKNTLCNICFDELQGSGEKFNAVTMLQAPCCRSGWFHKWCLQRMANVAGYFFSCPLCKDSATFRKQLPLDGIFIPDKDADWELEENAYADLLIRPKKCDANVCKNKQGREGNSTKNPFLICNLCGSIAMHKNCLPLTQRKQFHCDECSKSLNKSHLHSSADDKSNDSLSEDNEDVFVDVCNDNESSSSDDFLGFAAKRKCNRIYDDIESSSNEDNDLCVPETTATNTNVDRIQTENEMSEITHSSCEFLSCIEDDKSSENSQTLQPFSERMNSTMAKSADCQDKGAETQFNHGNHTMQMSCIADRTRRKSAISLDTKHEQRENTIASNNSCSPVANRTRRKFLYSNEDMPSYKRTRTFSSSSSSSSSQCSAFIRQRSTKRTRQLSSIDHSDETQASSSSSPLTIKHSSVKRKRVRRLSSSDGEGVGSEQIINSALTETVMLQKRFTAKLYGKRNIDEQERKVHKAYLS